MACLDMYNNSPHSQSPASAPMSPRISFSNDFVESHHHHHNNNNNNKQQLVLNPSTAPASSDFEFSVSNYNMLSADELFFKGRLLPFKDNNGSSNNQMQRTLRDELLLGDDDNDHVDFSLKPPKASSSSSNRWKGFLGLRKSHIGSKKPEKSDGSFDASKSFAFSSPPEDANLTKSPQDMVSNEGPGSSDMEMGI